MENKETGKRIVANEELMQKLEALEKCIEEIHDAVFLQLNTMQMYNVILQKFINDADLEKTAKENKVEYNALIKSSSRALRAMLITKVQEWNKEEKECCCDKYSLVDELLKAIFG